MRLRKANWLGIQPDSTHVEKIIATLGGIVSLTLITAVSGYFLGLQGTLAVVPSMGAATVLLFAVPHGPLSQPWALLAGNLLSAFVGVTCAKLVDNPALASGLAVGLAIGGMHLCRCIHPPGGATALAAVIGGDSVHQLGYQFLLTPVLLNCGVILVVALLFNNLFPWRRYPVTAMRYRPLPLSSEGDSINIRHIQQALKHLRVPIDVSAAELRELYRLADDFRKKDLLSQLDFEPGGVYSNNRPGSEWAVRKIIDHASHPDPEKELIIYKVLEGRNKNTTGSCSRQEFAQWAKQKLQPAVPGS